IGDDVTDEDVFEVLQGCGIGIVVRDGAGTETPLQSAAHYALENQEQVGLFLQMLIAMLRERRLE
ncbi:MAG: trehalose-phosphatase, partial [Desulfobacterales bacterium]|nr:trehalose-phosphatase [Desulfobacterales bacterium]